MTIIIDADEVVQDVLRAIRLTSGLNKGRRDAQTAYRNSPCVYCGGKQQTIDHVIPMCSAVDNTLANLVPSCQKCNGKKADMHPFAFFRKYPSTAEQFVKFAIYASKYVRERAEVISNELGHI